MLYSDVSQRTTLRKINTYQENEVMSSSPEKLVLFLYDQAIVGCKANDNRKASKAVAQLIDSLDFKYKEIATGLFRLYEYSMQLIQKQEYSKAQVILSDLRNTWIEALRQQKAA